jgi:hypothetical protein
VTRTRYGGITHDFVMLHPPRASAGDQTRTPNAWKARSAATSAPRLGVLACRCAACGVKEAGPHLVVRRGADRVERTADGASRLVGSAR